MKTKNIVITGGTGVLLTPVAIEYKKQGANVALVGFNVPQNVVKDFEDQDILVYDCNVLDEKEVGKLVVKIKEEFGKVDVLINGAGGNHPTATTDEEEFNFENINNQDLKTFFDLNMTDFKKINELNFLSTVIISQAILPLMLENEGNILNVSSMSSYSPMTKVPAYSAAKASVDNFTKWLAVYFAKSNIRVNSIAPGFFVTVQNEKLLLDEKGNYTSRSQKIINNTPQGRFGTTQDLIEPILFLTDNQKSKFITGVTLPIDGGFLAYSGV